MRRMRAWVALALLPLRASFHPVAQAQVHLAQHLQRSELEKLQQDHVAAGDDAGVLCDPWCFLHAYPRQYVAHQLAPSQHIEIDGSLDDAAWKEVGYSTDAWVDIAQPLFPKFALPAGYETKIKVRWDSAFLYIGASIGEPYVTGVVTGHNPTLATPNPISNSFVPYYDNDFEVFVDVSGTNYYYKEFEMNFRNATYDVFWHVPDGSVPCSDGVATAWCSNSSSTVYPGSWSMWPQLRTATARVKGGWTAEIAFPLRGGAQGGGLLDGGADWERFDPNKGTKYWLVDFARAEHPFFVSDASLFKPLCSDVQREHPTLLGTDQWTCYYEYVWQSVGGTKYMHNPDLFGFLEFAPPLSGGSEQVPTPPCRALEWPARYVLSQVWRVQTALAAASGQYANDIDDALLSRYCTVANSCNATDLSAALTTYKDIFNLQIEANNAAKSCVNYKPKDYTGGPCFTAKVDMVLYGHRVSGSISENRYLDVRPVRLDGSSATTPCLPAP